MKCVVFGDAVVAVLAVRDLAEKSGVHRNTVTRIETDATGAVRLTDALFKSVIEGAWPGTALVHRSCGGANFGRSTASARGGSMGWFSNKVTGWATKTQARELEEFISRLRMMDADEIGMLVAFATDRRHKQRELYGWDMLYPSLVETVDVTSAMKLNGLIRQLQKGSNPIVAASLMVWLHTLRAATSLELRGLGRELWRQLERGFPYAEDAADGAVGLGAPLLHLDGHDCFPDGLTPNPLWRLGTIAVHQDNVSTGWSPPCQKKPSRHLTSAMQR